MAAREGSTRQNLSTRGSWDGRLSWELQQADPGGLRRRRLAWRGPEFELALGDLGPWPDHPLLEGTSLVSGPRDTAVDRQILFGSGTRPNGVDLALGRKRLRLLARQRVERSETASARLSTAAALEVGPLSAGFRVSDSGAAAPATHLATMGWNLAGIQGEAAVLDPWGSRSEAFQIRGGFGPDTRRLEIQLHHLEPGFHHDGISRRWATGTAGSIGLKTGSADAARLSVRLEGARDSLGKVGARTLTSLRLADPLFDLELAGSFSENLDDAPRWTVGSRLETEIGFLHPRLAFAFSDSALHPSASVQFEAAARSNGQELSAIGSYSTNAGPRWTAQHRTAMEAGDRRLEFVLSVATGLRASSKLAAQGSVACVW